MTQSTSDAYAVDQYVLRSVNVDEDVEKLVAMWQASDDQWPGTWSRGVPLTAQRLRDWLQREKRIDALVWDTGDAIAGYCSLWEQLDEPYVTYIALLNIAPGYQKLSLARRFLTRYVERVIELGSVRLDLHTWAGNLKAVPLYKKCGFFWLPGTSVHMLNFLPSILTMPVARPFFEQHDWYGALKRDLTQSEDDERWEGMKVFTYRFEKDGDHLTVWADREARTITAVETDDLFAAALATELEPPRGLPTPIRWRITNKRGEPIRLSLIASGTTDLKLDYRTSQELAGGETITLEANVAVASRMADVKGGKPVPAIKTLLIIDGLVIELGTGLRPRAAVEVGSYPEYITLTPRTPQTVELQLRSRLKRDVAANVSITAPHGLHVERAEASVQLPGEGYAGIGLTLQAEHAGVFELPVIVDADLGAEHLHLPVQSQTIFALPPGGVLAARSGDNVRVENERMRLIVEEEGAGVEIYDRATGHSLAHHNGYASPPAAPSEYQSGSFDLQLDRSGANVVVIASMASRKYPNFVLRKRITVNSSAVVAIGYDFDNLGSEPQRFQLLHGLGVAREDVTITLPLKTALVQGAWGEFPGQGDDDFKKASTYAEEWAALEVRGTTVGVIWTPEMDDVDWQWGMNTLTRFYECPPRSRVQPPVLHIYAGDGDWRAVRQLWQRLAGRSENAGEQAVAPRKSLIARLDPPVATTTAGAVEATLLIEHHVSRSFNGKASLALPAGWQADRAEFELQGLSWRRPFTTVLGLTAPEAPGAATARLTLQSADEHDEFDLPLIRLGNGSAVDVRRSEREGHEVLLIDNGHIEVEVAPGFGGTVSALREGAANHLLSSLPDVGVLAWMNNWYGGVMPILMPGGEWNWPGRLGQAMFTGEPLAIVDTHDIEWRGVRQRATLEWDNARGLAVEIDILTVGGSPVVKYALRAINTSSVVRHLETLGFYLFSQPDGSRTRTTLWNAERRLMPGERMTFIKSGHWAAAANPETGRALALISPTPEVRMGRWGAHGGHPELLTEQHIPANGSVEVTAYIVLVEDIEAARRWAALREL